ncbi:MAG: hypothetical protein R6V54_03960 [Desulfobacteraceae bacterium]
MKKFSARGSTLFTALLVAATCFFSVGLADTPASDECRTLFSHGSINWTTGTVQATGKALPPEKEMEQASEYILSAARADASRNLLFILKQIRLTANISVEKQIAPKDRLMAGIEEIASNALIKEQHYSSDRSMEVTLETSLLGGFLQLVLPEKIKQIPKIKTLPPEQKPDRQQAYTGLVIDARKLDFEPVLYPVVVSEQGEEIYSALFISREHAVQRGVCQYVCGSHLTGALKKAGNNPIMVKGLRKGRESNSTIVIAWPDAEKIKKAPEHYRFMRQCRVVILLDKPHEHP